MIVATVAWVSHPRKVPKKIQALFFIRVDVRQLRGAEKGVTTVAWASRP